jgi:hypothetical protein
MFFLTNTNKLEMHTLDTNDKMKLIGVTDYSVIKESTQKV